MIQLDLDEVIIVVSTIVGQLYLDGGYGGYYQLVYKPLDQLGVIIYQLGVIYH
jgi:hypothetical protein